MSVPDHAQHQVLRGLYELSETIGGRPWIPNGTLRQLVGMPHPSVTFLVSVEDLSALGYVEIENWKQRDSRIKITEHGWNFISAGLTLELDPEEVDPFEIVHIDASRQDVQEVSDGLANLLDQLQRGNDVGDLTAGELEVAIAEVGLLRRSWTSMAIRVDEFRLRAASSLQWIAGKAAVAVVGDIAKHVLDLIRKIVF